MHMNPARTFLRPMKLVFAALVAAVMFAATTAYAFLSDRTEVVGFWKTIDDEDGQAKSIVKIYEVDGKYYGRVDRLLKEPGKLCEACEGEDHNKPIEGMVVLWGLQKDGDTYSGGKIFDPKKGKTYRAKLWLEEQGAQLKVRGYLGPFFRTQTWYRQ